MALALYAHVRIADNFIKAEQTQESTQLPSVDPAWAWRPVTEVQAGVAAGPDTINEGPVYTFSNGNVTKTLTRRALTAPELDARKEGQMNQEAGQATSLAFNDTHNILFMLWRISNPGGTLPLFNAAITTFKAGQNAITPAQSRAYLKAFLP